MNDTKEAIKSAILSASLDGVVTMDADGCVVELNPAAEEMFGYRALDVIEKAGRKLGVIS